MAPYSRNYLSLHFKTDTNECVAYMLTKKSQLMQQSFAVEDPYQNMLPQISSFSFVLVLTL